MLAELFGERDDYYPGSKRKRRPLVEPAQRSVVVSDWDTHPVKKMVGGQPCEFFLLGALAKALGRPMDTIRFWMKQGYLPSTKFRLQVRKKDGTVVNGRRLYTRPMIELAIEEFSKRHLLSMARIDWPAHADLTNDLAVAWKQMTPIPLTQTPETR